MTHSDEREHCLERARMHEKLASTTRDSAARQMHQAMAAEFRRRADSIGQGIVMRPRNDGPTLELLVPVQSGRR